MTSNSNIDELIKDLRTENSNSSWQSYCDEFEQAIQQLLDEAYKKGYIDGGIAEITK